MTARVDAARDRLQQAVDELRAITGTAAGDELCAVLTAVEAGQRSLDQVSVAALAAVERQGVFTGHGYRSAAGALADLLRWDPRRARRHVTAAEQVVERVGLGGETLPARLEATAMVFATGEIGMRHVEVIATVLGTAAAQRLSPGRWADAEQQLAAHAPDYTPAELHTWGTQLIDLLDQDGPDPDDPPEPRINELHVTRHKSRPGGSLRGRFEDPEMFERIAAVLDTHARPRDPDDPRTPAERRAEGLAEVCGYALAHAPGEVLPETGGRRPQLVVTIRLEDLETRARAGMLEFAGQTSPAALRMLACDAAVIPVVLGGTGQPLDVGRATRTIPDGLRRAVTARDRGCAFPGCDRPPAWCQIHHIEPWEHGGPTTLDNLVMVCTAHHRLAHHSGWQIRTPDGRPEFVPPGWIDPGRRPRRQPDLTHAVDLPVAEGRQASLDASGRPPPPGRTDPSDPPVPAGRSAAGRRADFAALFVDGAGADDAVRDSSTPRPVTDSASPRVVDVDSLTEAEECAMATGVGAAGPDERLDQAGERASRTIRVADPTPLDASGPPDL